MGGTEGKRKQTVGEKDGRMEEEQYRSREWNEGEQIEKRKIMEGRRRKQLGKRKSEERDFQEIKKKSGVYIAGK